jgi:hypothetical protein
MLQLGFDYHENLTEAMVDELLDRCQSGEYQPQVGVKTSA